ncbi:MAG: hypothetical protein QOE70_3101 [Chthoniobacter sp.]|jgi:hypothetical protein|nr:hypothetical protein [Chthoniobacter sp.]
MKLSAFHRPQAVLALLVVSAFAAASASAHDAKQMLAKSVVEPEAPPAGAKLNLLLNVEFADKYVTPRGQIVRDEGLTIEPLLLAFLTLYEGDSFISSFKFVGGVWADYGTEGVSEHPPFGSNPKTTYTEIDPIFGVSIGLAKLATLSVTYTAFVEQILDIETSHHLEVKLSFDDSRYLGAFALNPYALFWKELDGKSTAAQVPFLVFGPSPFTGKTTPPGEGYYFEFGVSPGFSVKPLNDLKVEFPCRVLLPSDEFYGEWYDSKSTVGLYELGVKASMPLKFMPKGYGNWSVHAGYKYMNFVDNNLAGMNQFNAPGKPTDEVHQVYGGISVFF